MRWHFHPDNWVYIRLSPSGILTHGRVWGRMCIYLAVYIWSHARTYIHIFSLFLCLPLPGSVCLFLSNCLFVSVCLPVASILLFSNFSFDFRMHYYLVHCICIYTSMYLMMCLSIYMCDYSRTIIQIQLFVKISLCLYVDLPIYLFITPPHTHTSIHIYHLSIYLHI